MYTKHSICWSPGSICFSLKTWTVPKRGIAQVPREDLQYQRHLGHHPGAQQKSSKHRENSMGISGSNGGRVSTILLAFIL